MAYLRKQEETYEIDYPLGKIWAAIPKVFDSLEWKIEEIDDNTHHVKAKTKASFMAYASVLTADAVTVDKNTARLTVKAETPVTTITSLADFGRIQHRVDLFIEILAKQLSSHKKTE